MRDYIFIRTDRCYEKINLSDILYIESDRNYVKIHLPERKVLTLAALSEIEHVLPQDRFYRIHRSYIISLEKIIAFDVKKVWLSGATLPIGETYRGVLDKLPVVVAAKPRPIRESC